MASVSRTASESTSKHTSGSLSRDTSVIRTKQALNASGARSKHALGRIGSDTRSRRTRSILVRKSKTFQSFNVFDEGVNRTPKPLDPYIYQGTRERQIASMTAGDEISVSKAYSETKRKSEQKFQSDTTVLRVKSAFFETGTVISMGRESQAFVKVFSDAMFVETPTKVPTHISLVLKETDTFFILDFPSWMEYKDSDEGRKVAHDNETYEFLTGSKGRNRRTVTVAVQTVEILLKTRDTDCVHIEMKDNGSYTSNWEMYDTMNEMLETTDETLENDPDVLPKSLDETISLDSYRMSPEERQASKIMKSPKFLWALCVVERLLANNIFNKQQKIFKDLLKEESTYTDDEIKYKYTLEHLWTFSSDVSNSKIPVVAMEWNPVNKDIVAVGHGKFFNTDWVTSIVNIWNIKNPVNPERTYKFVLPVTTLGFSLLYPNILGVGFYNGKIILINISRKDLCIVASTPKSVDFFSDICTQIKFLVPSRLDGEDELVAIYENGKVLLFTTNSTRTLKCQQIMCTARADGKLKGIETLRKCAPLKISASTNVEALVFCQHPVDPTIYYVGTSDGVIHICSKNYLNQHLDMFLAHEGPVFNLKFHPFCPKIFATSGSDMYTRIWTEGVWEPIFQYSAGFGATVDFMFSPTHPTIMVTVRKNRINIWDIQRQTFKHQSSFALATNSYCTKVGFTDNGKCIYVGDNTGKVHLYALKDMPYPPFFPENLLISILKQILMYKPHALQKIITGLKKTSIRKRMGELKIKPPRPVHEEDATCKALDLEENMYSTVDQE